MNNIWTKKLKSAFIWLSAYMNFIAFALVGGYCIVKSEDEELQTETKRAFWVTVIFAVISAALTLFNYLGGFSKDYYYSSAYEFYTTCASLVNIARIVVYAVFAVLVFLKKETTDAAPIIEEEASAVASEADANSEDAE